MPGLRKAALIFLALFAASSASARDATSTFEPVRPPSQPEIRLSDGQSVGPDGREDWFRFNFGEKTFAVRNVVEPTVTPFLPPQGKANGTAVLVVPGGAYMLLAMEMEGWDVARALNARGITAFVLKYRIIPTPKNPAEAWPFIDARMTAATHGGSQSLVKASPHSTPDALAALRFVRQNAGRWGVDRQKVGMIGFSAGAMTSLNAVLAAPAAEQPAFLGYIYGPQDAVDQVPPFAPPLFDALAFDDPFFSAAGFPIATSWLAAKRPVEVHGYQTGGHGFGVGQQGTTTSLVIDEFVSWLSMNGF